MSDQRIKALQGAEEPVRILREALATRRSLEAKFRRVVIRWKEAKAEMDEIQQQAMDLGVTILKCDDALNEARENGKAIPKSTIPETSIPAPDENG